MSRFVVKHQIQGDAIFLYHNILKSSAREKTKNIATVSKDVATEIVEILQMRRNDALQIVRRDVSAKKDTSEKMDNALQSTNAHKVSFLIKPIKKENFNFSNSTQENANQTKLTTNVDHTKPAKELATIQLQRE